VQQGAQFIELVQRLFNFGRAGKGALCRERSERSEKHGTQKESDSRVTHVSTF